MGWVSSGFSLFCGWVGFWLWDEFVGLICCFFLLVVGFVGLFFGLLEAGFFNKLFSGSSSFSGFAGIFQGFSTVGPGFGGVFLPQDFRTSVNRAREAAAIWQELGHRLEAGERVKVVRSPKVSIGSSVFLF